MVPFTIVGESGGEPRVCPMKTKYGQFKFGMDPQGKKSMNNDTLQEAFLLKCKIVRTSSPKGFYIVKLANGEIVRRKIHGRVIREGGTS